MRGLSEAAVAKAVGIAQPFYHRIEMGTSNPSVLTAKNISSLLGFDWTLFFPDDKSKEVSA